MAHQHEGALWLARCQIPQGERGILDRGGKANLREEAIVRNGHEAAHPGQGLGEEAVLPAPAAAPAAAVQKHQQRRVRGELRRTIEIHPLPWERPVGQTLGQDDTAGGCQGIGELRGGAARQGREEGKGAARDAHEGHTWDGLGWMRRAG